MSIPRRHMPSIASLRALEALDRLGSASSVAAELSLTQSAVSRQLQTLETQMGMELIDRSQKRLLLTPAAKTYVEEVRPALAIIAQASLNLQTISDGGTLNLAILPTFGMRWLVPRLPAFTRIHPQITINMTTRIVPFSFTAEPFDAAIHFGSDQWPQTERLLLRSEKVVPVCSPELVPAGRSLAIDDLSKLPLLHIRSRPDAWANWLATRNGPQNPAANGMSYDQFSTITQAALHGLGVALMPDYLVERELASGQLVAPWGDPIDSDGAYYLVWPVSKARHRALAAFRNWLKDQAEPEDPLPR